MNSRTLLLLALVVPTAAGAALAETEPSAVIGEITGLTPEVKDGVVKVSMPRSDLSVVVDRVSMTPFQGLTSWVAFTGSDPEMILMGDLALTEGEVNATMSAALGAGLEVTALHNHFFYDRPRIFFMHIAGKGPSATLARAVRGTFDAQKRARGSGAEGFGGPSIPSASAIDPAPLEAILDQSAESKGGIVKFVFEKQTTMHGAKAGAAMGVNTWAAFAGSPDAAVVDGDFATYEDELQPVLKALRRGGVNVVAIHNHMTHESPRVVFLHYWAKGTAADLARAIRGGLEAQER